jgi:pantoate--beta-alanine ligase
MRKAREENEVLVASIFVNPTQFIAGEDFDKYPRTFERDTELLKSCGVVRTSLDQHK